jgi:formylmethanofuran dehydrogenase subunit C
MAVISLQPRYVFSVPVEAKCVSPDAFAGKSLGEISKLPVWEGNRQRTLGDLFEIEGDVADKPEDFSIHILGDLRKVTRIGSGMSEGEIIVNRDAGVHLGEEMKGGKITVEGNADSWLGAMMKGGTIEVKGNAGDYVGAAYRGSVNGMRGGRVIIHGSAGNELGCFMRKGLIKVYGGAAQFAGMHMKDGTILIMGDSERRAGAEMTGGKIVVNGRLEEVLPTFSIDGVKAKVKVNGDEFAGPFYVFVGDMVEKGRGKLYVAQSRNSHLKSYEQYL